MLRWTMIALVAITVSACTVGLPSTIDAAPFEARLAASPVMDGTYCVLTSDDGELLVQRQSDGGEIICAIFRWDSAERVVRIEDPKGTGKPTAFAPVDLGDGIFLLQLSMTEEEKGGAPFSFTLMAGVVHGGTMVVLPLPSDERTSGAATGHPGVTVSAYKSSGPLMEVPAFSPSGDTAEPVPIPNPDIFYVSGGAMEDIHAFARELAIMVIGEIARKTEEEGVAFEHGAPMFVRDTLGAESHPPTPEQRRDIDAIVGKLRALER